MGIIVSEPIIWITCSAIVGVAFIVALKKLSGNTGSLHGKVEIGNTINNKMKTGIKIQKVHS